MSNFVATWQDFPAALLLDSELQVQDLRVFGVRAWPERFQHLCPRTNKSWKSRVMSGFLFEKERPKGRCGREDVIYRFCEIPYSIFEAYMILNFDWITSLTFERFFEVTF